MILKDIKVDTNLIFKTKPGSDLTQVENLQLKEEISEKCSCSDMKIEQSLADTIRNNLLIKPDNYAESEEESIMMYTQRCDDWTYGIIFKSNYKDISEQLLDHLWITCLTKVSILKSINTNKDRRRISSSSKRHSTS